MTKKESKTPRKLRLNKETLRNLTPTELKNVHGGQPNGGPGAPMGSEFTPCCNSGNENCNSAMC